MLEEEFWEGGAGGEYCYDHDGSEEVGHEHVEVLWLCVSAAELYEFDESEDCSVGIHAGDHREQGGYIKTRHGCVDVSGQRQTGESYQHCSGKRGEYDVEAEACGENKTQGMAYCGQECYDR